MKKILLFFLSILVISCSKNKFVAPEGFDKFVGTWASINSDEKIEIRFYANGKLEMDFEIQRSFKRKFKKVVLEKSPFGDKYYLNFFYTPESSTSIISFFVNSGQDTIHQYYSFNQPGQSLDQSVKFVKIK